MANSYMLVSFCIITKYITYYIPVAWSEYSGKMSALVVCREECPWQTKALMMENLYLKKENEYICGISISFLLLLRHVELWVWVYIGRERDVEGSDTVTLEYPMWGPSKQQAARATRRNKNVNEGNVLLGHNSIVPVCFNRTSGII